MGFGMYPGTGWPVPTPDDFPNFIQFQEDGVNLGGPDADTVNFTGNVSATRGEGENANVVTAAVAREMAAFAWAIACKIQPAGAGWAARNY
jgi:hypothetical protein